MKSKLLDVLQCVHSNQGHQVKQFMSNKFIMDCFWFVRDAKYLVIDSS